MFRVGIVKQQDVPNCRVRVTFPAHQQLISWWLPVVTPKTQNDKAYWMPDVGEQVVCFMDEHFEDGCVLGSIFSQPDQPPANMSADKWHVTFKDGSTVEYDRAHHVLAINIVPTNSDSHTPTINITCQGPVNVTANSSSVNLSAPQGDITFKTNEHQDSVNGIINSYNGHTHAFADSSGDTGDTQGPDQQMS